MKHPPILYWCPCPLRCLLGNSTLHEDVAFGNYLPLATTSPSCMLVYSMFRPSQNCWGEKRTHPKPMLKAWSARAHCRELCSVGFDYVHRQIECPVPVSHNPHSEHNVFFCLNGHFLHFRLCPLLLLLFLGTTGKHVFIFSISLHQLFICTDTVFSGMKMSSFLSLSSIW